MARHVNTYRFRRRANAKTLRKWYRRDNVERCGTTRATGTVGNCMLHAVKRSDNGVFINERFIPG